jgi:hypothetical protein
MKFQVASQKKENFMAIILYYLLNEECMNQSEYIFSMLSSRRSFSYIDQQFLSSSFRDTALDKIN